MSACPYDIPDHLPEVLIVLGDHLHDPNPIPATVKRVLQDFKRTHQDNWTEHKVSPSFVSPGIPPPALNYSSHININKES